METLSKHVTSAIGLSWGMNPFESSDQPRDREGPKSDDQAASVDFAELVSQARAGDERAIDHLWNQCRTYLITIATRNLDPAALQKFGASDVVQQSMLIANKKLPQFDGSTRAEFFAWMKQVVLFECRQSSRRYHGTNKRAISRERSMAEDSTTSDPSFQVSDPHLTPSTQAARDEQATLVRHALSRLPPIYRQVIELRNWEDHSFESIGVRIGRSAEATRKIWTRAIVKLEQELKKMNAL